MKQRRIRFLAIGISMVLLSSYSVSYGQEEKLILTANQAKIKMLENNDTLMNLDQSIRAIKKSEEDLLKSRSKIEANYNDYLIFKSMYENGIPKDPLGETSYKIYQMMFGKEPTLSYKDIYNRYITPMEITTYSIYQQKEDLKMDREIALATLNYTTDKLLSNLKDLERTLEWNKNYIQVLEKKQLEMALQYKLGKVSKYDFEKSELELSKSKLELGNLQRNYDNLNMSVKSFIGVPYSQEVVFALDKDKDTLMKNLSVYQNTLVSSNLKLIKSQAQITMLERENRIMSEYIKDHTEEQRIVAEQKLASAKLNHKAILSDLKIKVDRSYIQTISNYKSYILANEKLKNSQQTAQKVKRLFNLGLAKQLDVLNAEIGVQQAAAQLEQAKSKYSQSINALDQVVKYGIDTN